MEVNEGRWSRRSQRLPTIRQGAQIMDIRGKIKFVFSEDDRDQVFNYMEWIRSASSDFGQSIRRNTTILLLLIAIFEVVVQSRKIALSIGPFAVARDSIVLVFIPAVVSYLFLQIAIDTQKQDRLETAFAETFTIWSSKATGSDLDSILRSSKPAYWGIVGIRPFEYYRFDRLEVFTSITFYIIIILGILAFEAQAYYVLFPVHISMIAGWAVSLFISLICLALSTLFAYAETGV
jgi:hypothetical protein